MTEIPKGATGKLQRIGLAAKLGLGEPRPEDRDVTSICVFGAGAIGGLMAAKLEMAGTPVTVVARGPHYEAHAAPRASSCVSEGKETVTQAARRHRPEGGRAAGLSRADPEGAFAAAGAGAAQAADRARTPPSSRRSTACPGGTPTSSAASSRASASSRSIPAATSGDALPPAQVLGCIVYPAADVRRARRDRAHLRRPLHPGRAGRQPQRARGEALRAADQGRPQGAGAAAHPRRALGQALGQHGLQPDRARSPARRSTR